MRRGSRGRLRAAAATVVLLGVLSADADVAPTPETVLADGFGGPGYFFGTSVDLDGSTAIVGALGGGQFPKAIVFTRSGVNWTEQQTLVQDDPTLNDLFGAAVAVEGDVALVGMNATQAPGKVYFYSRSGATWTQTQKFSSLDPANADYFGAALSISGTSVLVGTSGGGAYVFTRSGAVWTQEQKLFPPNATVFDAPGATVALSGETAVFGARFKDGGRGSVYVYVRAAGIWTLQQELVLDVAAAGDHFGVSVAIDGDTIVAGAQGASAAFVFTRSGTTWTQQAKLVGADAVGGIALGESVAFHGDVALVAAPGADLDTGRVYAFAREGTVWSQRAKLLASDGATFGQFGRSLVIEGDRALIGADHWQTGQGLVYVLRGFVSGTGGGGPAPTEAFFPPTKVVAKANAKNPAKSTFTATGSFDVGTGAATDLTGSVALNVAVIGGFSLDIPSLARQGKKYVYTSEGTTFSVTPSPSGSSRATFSLKKTGDVSSLVGPHVPLHFSFSGAGVADARGTVDLHGGKYGFGKIRGSLVAPTIYPVSAKATVKGGGKDTLTLVIGIATDGSTLADPVDLTVAFGPTWTASFPAASFTGKKFKSYKAKAGTATAVLNYVKESITVTAKNVDLGTFAEGPNATDITVSLGADTRGVRVLTARKGKSLKY